MSVDYSMLSDRAYVDVLKVLPAGQRWFSFDVPMDEARKGKAKRFGMTLWNFHTVKKTREFESWAITRDPISGAFWYRVGKERSGETSRNRKSLWEALQISLKESHPVPMRGILKDGKTRRCAPTHVFAISDVRAQADGSALWLKLEVPSDELGVGFDERPLPASTAIGSAQPTVGDRANVLSEDHYVAVRDAAARVFLDGAATRRQEIEKLNRDLGINRGTASALLNNFKCLVEGQDFKAPMRSVGLQIFIDAIVAGLGAKALPNVIVAVEGYVTYAEKAWNDRSAGIRAILNALRGDWAQEALLQSMVRAVPGMPSSSPQQPPSGPSEILREVWVRGAQHAAFRRELLRRWGNRCSVHGTSCNEQLRASHIVAWSQDEAIRGDVNNGLLLSVPLDNLFDQGLISFNDTGAIIRSEKLRVDTAEHFGVREGLRIAWGGLKDNEVQALRANLARHRRNAGFET